MQSAFQLGNLNWFRGPLWFLLPGSQMLCWCCKANWGNILQYNKFSFACFLWLINERVWLLKKKKNNKATPHIPCYPSLSTQSHGVILVLHRFLDVSHPEVLCGSLWRLTTAMGSCACSVHFHTAAAATHRQVASHKLLAARNRCPWACFLCSFTFLQSLCSLSLPS